MGLNLNVEVIIGLFLFTCLINLPFGYLRGKSRRYSFRWFLYIHLPIPFVFLARVLSHIDFKYIPIFVVAAVIGQVAGSRIEV
jgi:hypothetical protein